MFRDQTNRMSLFSLSGSHRRSSSRFTHRSTYHHIPESQTTPKKTGTTMKDTIRHDLPAGAAGFAGAEAVRQTASYHQDLAARLQKMPVSDPAGNWQTGISHA